MSETERLTAPGSPLGVKRKPVPTPRSTLRKPHSSTPQKILFVNEDNHSTPKLRNLSLNNGADSQGETPIGSQSPDDAEPHLLECRPLRGEDGEDILAALEKIPGVGSLRSLGSLGSSVPSLSLDRVKREASSHSLGPSSTGPLLERQRSVPTGTFHHTRRPWQQPQNQVLLSHHRIQPKVILKSPNTPPSSTSPIGEELDDDELTSSSPLSSERRDSKGSPKTETSGDGSDNDRSKIQERPLPDLPNKQTHPESIDIVSTEQVYTALLTPEDHYCELSPRVTHIPASARSATQTDRPLSSVIKIAGRSTSTNNCSMTSSSSHKLVNGYLTMTGTIKRGRHKPEKTVDIQLNLTPDHLKLIEKRVLDKYHDKCYCGIRRGPHVFILSLLCLPFIWIYSTLQAFILGSMTLFNIFIYYNEERTCCHTLMSPFILLLYPFWIVPVTLFLGIYSAIIQVSWYWDSWMGELRNPDKGFMNWVCQKLNVPDCAPYQVVVLNADGSAVEPVTI